jgi:hypothetical protein
MRMAFGSLLAAWTSAEGAYALERFLLAKTTDRTGAVTYEVLAPDEYRRRAREVDTEKRFCLQARALAEAEWRAGESTRRKPFPHFQARSIRVVREFTAREAAEAKALQCQEREDEDARDAKTATTNRRKGQSKDENDRERAREELDRRALALFEAKLAELMARSDQTVATQASKPARAGEDGGCLP